LDGEHRAFIRKQQHHRTALHDMINSRVLKYNQYRKSLYDEHRAPPTHYLSGEHVKIDWSSGMVGNKAKLSINRREAEIIDRIGENAYIVRYVDNGYYQPVNVDRMYKMIQSNVSKITDEPMTVSASRHEAESKTVSEIQNQKR